MSIVKPRPVWRREDGSSAAADYVCDEYANARPPG